MQIRQEKRSDRDVVYEVIREAFSDAEGRSGQEQELVNALRGSRSFLPKLSLVAVEGRTVVGHILFTKADIGGQTELALAPVCVLPEYRKKGIGTALIREGHRIAETLGFTCSAVLGSPFFFGRTGYLPASLYGVKPPKKVPDENFMLYRFSSSREAPKGTVLYDAAFRLYDGFRIYDGFEP